MLILGVLGMYFGAAVVFVTKSSLLFKLTVAILWVGVCKLFNKWFHELHILILFYHFPKIIFFFVSNVKIKQKIWMIQSWRNHGLQTPNKTFFFIEIPNFLGLGRQYGRADKFWDIWCILGQFIMTHFGTVGPFSNIFH